MRSDTFLKHLPLGSDRILSGKRMAADTGKRWRPGLKVAEDPAKRTRTTKK